MRGENELDDGKASPVSTMLQVKGNYTCVCVCVCALGWRAEEEGYEEISFNTHLVYKET